MRPLLTLLEAGIHAEVSDGKPEDAFSNSQYVASNDELKRVGKETIVAHFKLLSLYLPGGTEDKEERLFQDSSCPSRESNEHLPNTAYARFLSHICPSVRLVAIRQYLPLNRRSLKIYLIGRDFHFE
jgi:hypothetical protein